MTKDDTSNKITPRDVFLHLLSIITLYFSAASLGILLYQIINTNFPDLLAQGRYFDPQSYFGPLRWAVASLTIVFPVYIWTNWQLHQEYQETPEKLHLKTRKWLLNFTVFAAALFIIGDLVAVIYRYLEGDLTTRFGLKVLTILAISASIFYSYVTQLHYSLSVAKTKLAFFNKAIIAIVVIIIISGFWIAGSPQEQRLKRFDQRRVSDLQDIQWQIINYWQKKDQLPSTLNQLEDPISGYQVPADPRTNKPYEYQATSELQFQLCAEFNTEAQDYNTVTEPRSVKEGIEPQNWAHNADHTCFHRIIDPELYQLTEETPLVPANH
jgi:hypothetical protein